MVEGKKKTWLHVYYVTFLSRFEEEKKNNKRRGKTATSWEHPWNSKYLPLEKKERK